LQQRRKSQLPSPARGGGKKDCLIASTITSLLPSFHSATATPLMARDFCLVCCLVPLFSFFAKKPFATLREDFYSPQNVQILGLQSHVSPIHNQTEAMTV
jgi:hypothetical protein